MRVLLLLLFLTPLHAETKCAMAMVFWHDGEKKNLDIGCIIILPTAALVIHSFSSGEPASKQLIARVQVNNIIFLSAIEENHESRTDTLNMAYPHSSRAAP